MMTFKQYLAFAGEQLARISHITKQSLAFHRDTQYAVPLDVGGVVEDVVLFTERWRRRVRSAWCTTELRPFRCMAFRVS